MTDKPMAFRPEDVGEIINPLDLPPEQADQICGKPLMDELRRLKDQPFTLGQYRITSVEGGRSDRPVLG